MCSMCSTYAKRYTSSLITYGDKLKFTSLKHNTKARRLAIGQDSWPSVMAIYKDGEKVDELVKDDCTPETNRSDDQEIHLRF